LDLREVVFVAPQDAVACSDGEEKDDQQAV
jgi:hypothetical protein